jgi:hypothetical protein
MTKIPSAARPQFEQGVRHLHRLGERALAEALAEIAAHIGGMPCMLAVLNEYRSLKPAQLQAAGGDTMPARRRPRVAA